MEEIDSNEWRIRSMNGEFCGFMGCREIPTSQCPDCFTQYCYNHIKIHVHVKKE